MKKTLLLLVAMAATLTTFADEWQKPIYSGDFQPLTADEVVYIYNPDAKMFLTEGNDYGTHASVGETGLQFKVQQYVPEGEGAEWDGSTYTIQANSIKNGSWGNVFIDSNLRDIYVDRREQADYFFKFKDLGSNRYQIKASTVCPNYDETEYGAYMVGRYTEYIDNQSGGIATGTGVIFGDEDASLFQTTWAFVSETDYNAYVAETERYEAALKLGEAIKQAEKLSTTGIDIASEKAVYANTGSDKNALDAATASVNKKILKYYEVVVTPDTPMQIDLDECNSIDGWTNGISADTWNTQTWIGEGWTGFEGTTLNIWGASLEGKAYKSLADLPNGIYVVSMAVFSEKMDGYIFANENQTPVPVATAGNVYKTTVEVTDGNLEYGFGMDEAGTNWVAIDNVVVNYYGIGVEAYRYWLNQLLADAPDFDEAIAQTSLVTEYNNILASVNTAETKEEILAIIPSYTEILNKVNASIDAYSKLKTALDAATELIGADDINGYYIQKLQDVTDSGKKYQQTYDEHTADDATVKAVTAEVTAMNEEAQNYIWRWQALTWPETGKLAEMQTVYTEKEGQYSLAAATAYEDFMTDYEALNTDELTLESVNALIEEINNIIFQLSTPAAPASDENPVDYTAKVQYPSFSDGATGWTNDGWTTCGKNDWNSFANDYVLDKQYLNLWNASNARVYQTLTKLPAGTYMLQISAFANAEGLEVYANEDCLKVVVGENEGSTPHVYDGSEEAEVYSVETTETDAESGEKSEVVVTPTTTHGNIYRIITKVGEEGTMEIGARNVGGGTVWGMIDNVKLTYYGAESEKIPTAIECIDAVESTNSNTAAGIYSLTGTRTATMQRGINIVKMADGTVKKVMVK